MKIDFTKEFMTKVRTKHYPLLGFFIQYGFNDSESESGYDRWRYLSSSVYPSNTFVYKDKTRISFKSETDIDSANSNFDMIYLFAIDLMKYPSGIDEFSSDDSPELYSQLAGIIYLDEERLDISINNILDLPLVIDCSFKCTHEPGQIQVGHYNSHSMGQSMYYYPGLVDNQLISLDSGLDRLKELRYKNRISDLDGVMTIKKSGVIQL